MTDSLIRSHLYVPHVVKYALAADLVPLFGVYFDGLSYIRLSAGLTGAADTKQLTFSFWMRKTGNDNVLERFFTSTSTLGGGDAARVFRVSKRATNSIQVIADTVLNVNSTNGSVEVDDGWQHILMSFDLSDTGKRHLYINDTSDLTVVTYTDANMDMTVADWSVGALPDGDLPYTGGLAYFWFQPGVYIDFSVEANRRKFRTADGSPADLGPNGEAPTGSTPIIYFRGPAVDFNDNLGTGGTPWTVIGTLTDM